MIVCLIWTMASVQYVVLDIVYVPVTVLRTTANVEHGKDLIALGPTLGRGIRTSAGPYDAKASSCDRNRLRVSFRAARKEHKAHFFFVGRCSAKISIQCFALNSRIKRGSLSRSVFG